MRYDCGMRDFCIVEFWRIKVPLQIGLRVRCDFVRFCQGKPEPNEVTNLCLQGSRPPTGTRISLYQEEAVYESQIFHNGNRRMMGLYNRHASADI